MELISIDFSEEEDALEEEAKIFYEAEGLDPEIVPRVEVDIWNDSNNAGQFVPEEENWRIELFPRARHLNHRQIEGNLSNFSILNADTRAYTIHEAQHAYFEHFQDLKSMKKELNELLTEEFTKNTLEGMHKIIEERLSELDPNEFGNQLKEVINGQKSFDEFIGAGEIGRDIRLKYIKENFGQSKARKYQRLIGLGGINETLSRVMSSKFLGKNNPSHQELYRGSDDYHSDTIAFNDMVYSLAKHTDVSNVKTEELVRYLSDNSYLEVLKKDRSELLDSFYSKTEV